MNKLFFTIILISSFLQAADSPQENLLEAEAVISTKECIEQIRQLTQPDRCIQQRNYHLLLKQLRSSTNEQKDAIWQACQDSLQPIQQNRFFSYGISGFITLTGAAVETITATMISPQEPIFIPTLVIGGVVTFCGGIYFHLTKKCADLNRMKTNLLNLLQESDQLTI